MLVMDGSRSLHFRCSLVNLLLERKREVHLIFPRRLLLQSQFMCCLLVRVQSGFVFVFDLILRLRNPTIRKRLVAFVQLT